MNSSHQDKLNFSLAVFGLLIVFSIPLFMQLDYLSIDSWDEALFAIRAYYIAEHGVPIKDFSQLPGLTEVHNSKPALMSYVQAGFMKLFGYNELALRLPTSLSFIALCFSLVYYSKKILQSYSIGIIASILLVSTPAMLSAHMGRSANQDIPFALFCFLFVVQAYFYIEDQKQKNLILSLVFFTMAFFTKSVSIFLCFPALILFAFSSKKIKQLIKAKTFWLGLSVILVIVLLSYFNGARHLGNVKRISHVIMHEGNFLFYLQRIFFEESFPLIFLLFFIYSIFQSEKPKFILLVILEAIVILTILSAAQTKLIWYAAPVYPFLTLASAYGIHYSLKSLASVELKASYTKQFFLYLAILIPPYVAAIKSVYLVQEPSPINELCQLLKRSKESFPEIKNIKLVDVSEGSYAPNVEYYCLLYKEKYNYQIELLSSLQKLNPGDYILVFDENQASELLKKYEVIKKLQFQDSYAYLVGSAIY
ncbi:MAG: glycosyltransferase family 39 protein [Chitinophagales bacterium]|nr:glycosyltransferase family 39 protein [Chitinophagales bacterium]